MDNMFKRPICIENKADLVIDSCSTGLTDHSHPAIATRTDLKSAEHRMCHSLEDEGVKSISIDDDDNAHVDVGITRVRMAIRHVDKDRALVPQERLEALAPWRLETAKNALRDFWKTEYYNKCEEPRLLFIGLPQSKDPICAFDPTM